MSSSGPTAAAGGQFAPVLASASPQRVTADEIDVDLQNLDSTEREIVEANDFIIYGKANIEQWNDPAPGEDDLYIEMEAFEGNVDQLLALENISIGHNDVRIGEPLESYTLDSESNVHLDAGETLELDAGDELRTEVIREGEPLPGDNGTADEDALWLAANLFGSDDSRGSRFSQKARLGAYYGELDGFSVTIDKTDMTVSDEGTVVHDLDFLAVTVGDDELIKNPGSSFGVAEFQALFGSASTADDPTGKGEDAVRPETLEKQLSMSGILQSVFGSSRDALASEAVQHAHDEGIDLETAVEQTAGDDNADAVMEAVTDLDEELSEQAATIVEEAEDADAIEDKAADLAEELDIDKEVVMAAVDELRDMQEADEGEGPPDDDDDDDDDNDAVSQSQVEQLIDERMTELQEDLEEQLRDVGSEGGDGGDTGSDGGLTEDRVEQLIDERVGSLQDTVEEQLDDLGSDVAETLSQQMATGATPGPAGGGTDSTDLESQIDDMADDLGLEVE